MNKNVRNGIEALKQCRAVADRKPLKEETIKTDSTDAYISILGNGNHKKGQEFLKHLATWLEIARHKHPQEEWKAGGEDFAYDALRSEFFEALRATVEHEERRKAELIDLIIVAIRTYNREWDND